MSEPTFQDYMRELNAAVAPERETKAIYATTEPIHFTVNGIPRPKQSFKVSGRGRKRWYNSLCLGYFKRVFCCHHSAWFLRTRRTLDKSGNRKSQAL